MSKKYKLIKWYPSLPRHYKDKEIMATTRNDHSGYYYKNNDGVNYFFKGEIENSPEFWEEIKEPLFTTEDVIQAIVDSCVGNNIIDQSKLEKELDL